LSFFILFHALDSATQGTAGKNLRAYFFRRDIYSVGYTIDICHLSCIGLPWCFAVNCCHVYGE